MSRCCGRTSVSIAVAVFLLVLLLVWGVACAWPWKYRGLARLALPRFLQRRSSRKRVSAETFRWASRVGASSPKTSDETKDHKPTAKGARVQNNYENVEAGLPKDKSQTEEALYENTGRPHAQEHVYENQTSSPYYDFQQARSSEEALQEENVYILPD
uniref:protein GAPT n=1 Tax=Jaculus jaculus TaxID=51337 RepID=UPI00033342F2|nr:protein GAPT [Jaculus jaculus]